MRISTNPPARGWSFIVEALAELGRKELERRERQARDQNDDDARRDDARAQRDDAQPIEGDADDKR